jgi:hypothetical protein
MKQLFFVLTVLMAAVVFQSCEKESAVEIPGNLKAPELPRASFYTIPTYDIAHDSITETDKDLVRGPFTQANWLHAGVSLLVWNSVVVVNLALPLNAIGQAFNQHAQYIGNQTFAWTYQYTATPQLGGGKYNIVLTGQYLSVDEVEWKLTASQIGGFQNFEWVTAITATNHTEAEFTFYRNPGNPEAYLRINSTYDIFKEAVFVRLTNVILNDPNNGNFIEYGANYSTGFNRSFQLHTGANDVLDIEWNAPKRFGRVRHAAHFGDADWHCWDENLFDVGCN